MATTVPTRCEVQTHRVERESALFAASAGSSSRSASQGQDDGTEGTASSS